MYKCHLARWACGTMKDGRDSGSHGNGSPVAWRGKNPFLGEAKIQTLCFSYKFNASSYGIRGYHRFTPVIRYRRLRRTKCEVTVTGQ